jgi:hypothetical protein
VQGCLRRLEPQRPLAQGTILASFVTRPTLYSLSPVVRRPPTLLLRIMGSTLTAVTSKSTVRGRENSDRRRDIIARMPETCHHPQHPYNAIAKPSTHSTSIQPPTSTPTHHTKAHHRNSPDRAAFILQTFPLSWSSTNFWPSRETCGQDREWRIENRE